MKKYKFPLFKKLDDYLEVLKEKENFDIKEIRYYCNNIHYSGAFCFSIDDYTLATKEIDSKIFIYC